MRKVDVSSIAPGQLDLFYNADDQLLAIGPPATYTLTFNNGVQQNYSIREPVEQMEIPVPAENAETLQDGFTAVKKLRFSVPDSIARGERVLLDLGTVNVMATLTLNGHQFDTLWMPPYTVDVSDVILQGSNDLKMQITAPTQAPHNQPTVADLLILKSTPITKFE